MGFKWVNIIQVGFRDGTANVVVEWAYNWRDSPKPTFTGGVVELLLLLQYSSGVFFFLLFIYLFLFIYFFFDKSGISKCLNTLLLLSPHLSFIIDFVCTS